MKKVIVLPCKTIAYNHINYNAGQTLDMEDENAIMASVEGIVRILETETEAVTPTLPQEILTKKVTTKKGANNA